jgi:hypothetical protein
MNAASHDPEYELHRWSVLVTLLSMDVVCPVCELMGLGREEFDRLQPRLRQQLVAERQRSGPPPDASLLVMHQIPFVNNVAKALRKDATPYLAWWERSLFMCDTRDHQGLRNWIHVLHRARNEPSLWQRLFPAPLRHEALERFQRSTDMTECYRWEREIDASPLSEWDLHLYALYLHDDILYSDEEHDEITDGAKINVELTIGIYQGFHFWKWVLKSCQPDQLDRLWQEARNIVDQAKMRWIREPPHPSTLDIGL